MAIETGGPAFPQSAYYDDNDRRAYLTSDSFDAGGMTLRDYFAAKAMEGMLTGPDFCDMFATYGHAAEAAYKFADAMLAARGAE